MWHLVTSECAGPMRIGMGLARLVLVVDDNIDAADMTAEVLRMHGITVAVAYSGPEGLAKALTLMPSVIFLDVGMPVMDGCAVALALRKDQAFQSVKIVALTAWGDDESRERIQAAGFDLHLTKPASLTTLVRAAQ
jgi:CheY-like chemotaxis protein